MELKNDKNIITLSHELMLGNYVYDRAGKLLRIDRFFGNKVEYYFKEIEKTETGIPICFHPLTEEIEYLKPIPLTEEWLLKFGFDDKDYTKGFIAKDFKSGNLILDFVLCKPHVKGDWQKNYCYDLEGYRYVEIEHVHSLQNLYFALTGEQLTITVNWGCVLALVSG